MFLESKKGWMLYGITARPHGYCTAGAEAAPGTIEGLVYTEIPMEVSLCNLALDNSSNVDFFMVSGRLEAPK